MSTPLTLDDITALSWETTFDFFLANYPSGEPAEEVMEMIEHGDPRVAVWEPFEFWDGASLAEQVEIHQSFIFQQFKKVAGLNS